MIEDKEILLDSAFEKQIAFWGNSVQDTNDIAGIADKILESGVDTISVPPEIVPFMWTYLEKANIEIYTRFDFAPLAQNIENDFDELVKQITQSCKQGATGVQIFIKMAEFERFMNLLSLVRDDLFFEHKLCICMDINDIDVHRWDMIFEKLRNLRVDVFTITFNKDDGKRSDFIGRVYGMLDAWNWDGVLHCLFLNKKIRIDEVMRLTETMQPKIYEKLRFFFED